MYIHDIIRKEREKERKKERKKERHLRQWKNEKMRVASGGIRTCTCIYMYIVCVHVYTCTSLCIFLWFCCL